MPFHLNTTLIPESALVLDLSQPVSPKSPHIPGAQPAYQMTLWTTADRTISALKRNGVVNEPGVNVELVNMTFHVGTHVDALGHFSCGACMHGGRTTDDTVGSLALRDLDAAQIPMTITRAILLDLSGLDGGSYLEGGRPITAQDIEETIAKNDVALAPGDIVVIHTGWGRFYDDRRSSYASSCPGITLEAARYLTDHKVFAIGSDTMAVEVVPGVDPTVVMPVHIHTLVDCGVYLIENLRTEELAQQGVMIFTLVMLPLNLKGATASPVRPLAIIQK
ncbi:cyclase family protein [Pusillimonas sp. ANT_WB101]|uniref:cyclase family protein n=1 Tax=Pusillimonas sp. ANT_WB101 TaxID=2597356 RepID=UPI0011EBE0B5|nr:cyclase family protein [Pusillimonas sp. ANT_WB101]KAA0892640.1 cyclase family protein [Pusillimonas sp. ANT_WB101]